MLASIFGLGFCSLLAAGASYLNFTGAKKSLGDWQKDYYRDLNKNVTPDIEKY